MNSLVRNLLPVDIESVPKSLVKTIRDFGFVNFCKILFFVSFRLVRYKIKLAQLPKQDFIERDILDGRMLLNRANGGISWDLLVNGIREENSTHFLRKELKPGMNILEIGANIGYYLIQESQIVGKDGYIFAFEPDPNNIDLLQKNIVLNDLQNVTLQTKALGNKKGEMDFYQAERGNLSNFAIPTENSVKVEMDRGDDLVGDQRIDYVRMDVEGYELDILKGMEQTLVRDVQGLFIEIHPYYLERLDSSLEHFLGWLEERGFELVKAYSDYDWNSAEFDNAQDLMAYKYAPKMVWRSFFRRIEK